MQLNADAIFISDTHLGSRFNKNEKLLALVREIEGCPRLFIIGDFIDFDAARQGGFKHFTQTDLTIIQKILRLSRKGTEVVWIYGNHDYGMRHLIDEQAGNILIKREAVYKDYLLIHGDQFDIIMRYNMRFLYTIGGSLYNFALWLNHHLSKLPAFRQESLSQKIKRNVKKSLNYISNFEELLQNHAKERGFEGVICGHIHHAADQQLDNGIRYLNCGDFVEDTSYIIEKDGVFTVQRI